MKCRYLGHAGWIFKDDNVTVLCDPWFNPDGAFYGGWFQFPNNEHLAIEVLKENIQVLYLSHRHSDHFDPWFLSKLNKDILVIIPDFKDKRLANDVKRLGFKNIKEMKETDSFSIKNTTLSIVPDEGYLDRDSFLLIETDGKKVLNLNDCHLPFDELKEKAGDIDILLMQTSGAIWWPYVYEYEKEKMSHYGSMKRKSTIERSIKYITKLNPKLVIPNAGPPLFLKERYKNIDLDRRNKGNAFPLMDEICEILSEQGINCELLFPGEVLDSATEHKKSLRKYENYSSIVNDLYEAKLHLNDDYFIEKYNLTNSEISETIIFFEKQIKKIVRYSKVFKNKVDCHVCFEFKDLGKFVVDFAKSHNECLSYTQTEFEYKFIFNPVKLAILFRNKEIDFDDYLLGMDFTCNRDPDSYNEFLFVILKNFDIKRLLIAEKIYLDSLEHDEEMMDIVVDGVTHRCQRYCPHMRADLKKSGFINDEKKLVCPLHNWAFDLKSGKCEQSSKHFLKVEKQNEG